MKDGFKGQRSIVLPQKTREIMKENLLTKSLHITDIGYYPQAKYHLIDRRHGIEEFVLLYCHEGEGFYEFYEPGSRGDRQDSTRERLSENQFVILPAGKGHKYGADADNPWTIYWIHFSGELAQFFAWGFDTPHNISPQIKSRICERNNLFEEMYNTLDSGLTLDCLEYSSTLLFRYLGTFKYLETYRTVNPGTTSTPLPDASESESSKIYIHFMKENIEKHLSLEELASFSGYSVSRFSAIFKKQTGYSPLTYFNMLKIQQTCHLLSSTKMTLAQIGPKVGIADTYYLSRLFHKIMGLSPAQYRKKY